MLSNSHLSSIGIALGLVMNWASATETGDVFISGLGAQIIGGTADGEISIAGGTTASIPYAILGLNEGVFGNLVVDEGSHLTISELTFESVPPGNPDPDAAIIIGLGGSGNVSVSAGSILDGVGFIGIAGNANSTSGLVVDGPGSEVNISRHNPVELSNEGFGGGTIPADVQGSMTIGGAGVGYVVVNNGGHINITQVPGFPVNPFGGLGVAVGGNSLGNTQGGAGGLYVDGAGSELNIIGDSGALVVGNSVGGPGGYGEVGITDGGKITVAGGLFTFEFTAVGSLPGTTGRLLIDGPGSTLVAGDSVGIATNATLTDADPANNIAAGVGHVTVKNGGRLEATFGTYLGVGGSLDGDGTILGGVYLYGGSLMPGNSPGDLTVIGDVSVVEGGVIELEIESFTTFDRILATGNFVLGGAEIIFRFAAGIDPKILETFDIGDFFQTLAFEGDPTPQPGVIGSSLFGTDSIFISAFAPGFDIESVTFSSLSGFSIAAQPVPLPPPIVLLAPLIGLVLKTRRVKII